MRIGSQRSLVRRFRESIRGTRGGRSSCLGLGGKRRHRRRGGGNVEIAPYCDFQGRWEGSENLPLVFLAFHGPPFPRSTSGPSTLTRPSLANFDRRFYPRQTAKNQKIPVSGRIFLFRLVRRHVCDCGRTTAGRRGSMSRLSVTVTAPAKRLTRRVDMQKVPVRVPRAAQNWAAGKRHPNYWPGERES